MIKSIYYKSDLKQLYREPMMVLLFTIPLFMAPLFKALLSFGVPIALGYITFDISLYNPYILSLALLLVPGMLGLVMGFMLLDDKDGISFGNFLCVTVPSHNCQFLLSPQHFTSPISINAQL